MTAFRRLFLTDPGNATLLSVASVNIIDSAPPSLPLGAGTGTVLVIGEFEKGPLEIPTEVTSESDREATFGGFGWAIAGNPHAGPVAQQSGGSEAWNGSGFITLANKRFNRLVVQRVDNSAGTVQFQRLACLTGGAGPFQADDADEAVFEIDGGPTTATATLSAGKAEITGVGASFPVALGGMTIILQVDDDDAKIVTFTDADVALADVIARINARFGSTIASNSGGQLKLSSVRAGSRARIEIVGGTGTALDDLGLPSTPTQDEWSLVVTADTLPVQLRVTRFVNGLATNFDTPSIAVQGGVVEDKRDALLDALGELGVPGVTFSSSSTDTILLVADDNVIITGFSALTGGANVTIANDEPGVVMIDEGTGNVGDSQAITTTEAATLLDAVANISASVDADGNLRVCNTATAATGTLEAISGDLLEAFGFTVGDFANANAAANVTIPAGTRVQDSSATGTVWITLSDTNTGTTGGPWSSKVRPFIDDDTAVTSTVGNVTLILDTLPDGFEVSNNANLTRLSAPQLDSRYEQAIEATLVDAPPANEVNYVVSARTSPNIRAKLRQNALDATAQGFAARKVLTRPRIGVSRAQAYADVELIRNERVQFIFPGFATFIPEIRDVGTAGGVGFTDDGVIDVGADSFAAAARSILLPEQSIGQRLADTNFGALQIVGLESAYDPLTEGSTKLKIGDYELFKRRGITGTKTDRLSGGFFVDDITSVDPTADPGRTAANRRAYADFINDSIFGISARYSKQVITPDLLRNYEGQLRAFLLELESPSQPQNARHQSSLVKNTTNPNVPQILRHIVRVKMFAIAESIVIDTQTGPTVVTQEVAA
ncbi:MAG TPA: hypothetical protein VM869_00500 [Enhygromyxa sp.]|nr:hypothetical protein [Enhygromyxa sp.]